MKNFSKFVPITLAVLLFASCETKKTEPKASTEPKVPAEQPAVATHEPEATATPEVVIAVSEKISEMISAYDDDREAKMEKYRNAESNQEKNKLREDMSQDSERVASQLLEIVKENPDDPATFGALDWVVTNLRSGDMVESAIDQLFDKYVDRAEMKDLCATIAGGLPSQNIETRLKTLIEKSPHREVKAIATFNLASYLSRVPDMVEAADDPRLAKMLGEDGVAYLKGFVQNDQEVETLYMAVVNDYADVKGPRDIELGERAEKALFALRFLAVGKEAPEIEGEDVDGESFKLSDYRGKVVMLDFWGDW